MAWNYRKRVKVAPGIYMNISKGGVRTKVGVRGASVTFGKNGSYINTGIPGTGYYYRQNIGRRKHKRPNIDAQTPQPQLNRFAKTGCLLIAIFPFLMGTALTSENYLWGVAAAFSLFFAVLAFIEGGKKLTVQDKDPKVFLDEAKSSLDNASNPTLRRILESFINSFEIIDEIDDEEKILEKLKEKPEKNADNIEEHEQTLAELKERLDTVQYYVDAELDADGLEAYGKMCEVFEDLHVCQKVWLITSEQKNSQFASSAATSVVRQDGCIFGGVFNYLRSQFDIPAFEVTGGTLFFYPKFIILAASPGIFQLLTYDDVTISATSQRFNEEDGVPSDAKRDGYTWRYVDKSGGPNLHFADNCEIPVAIYGKLLIKYGDSIYTFLLSNEAKTRKFAKAFDEYKASLSEQNDKDDSHSTDITKKIDERKALSKDIDAVSTLNNPMRDVYPLAKEVAYSLFKTLKELDRNEEMRRVLAKLTMNDTSENMDLSQDSHDNRIFPTLDNRLAFLALTDIIKCYEKLCKTNSLRFKPECMPIAILLSLISHGDTNIWDDFDLISEKQFEIAQGYYNLVKKYFSVTDIGDKLYVVELLQHTDVEEELANRYAVLMYRYSLITANADGKITPSEKEWLSHLLSFTSGDTGIQDSELDVDADNNPEQSCEPKNSKRKNNRKKSKLSTPQKASQKTPSGIGDALKELTALIGLASVKYEVENIYNLIKIQKVREEKGLKSSNISYHCVFTGNPGTGKTTVARLVAQIYKDLGILSKGHLVETDRSGLVAEYVGQTAVKTNKIIDSALDGVLFIDEAYSLVQGGLNDYGMEAIATLLKRMEDNRDRLVVILAGYSDEMKQFIDANPGLQSRFNRYIHFEDYNVEDLVAIYIFNLNKYDYKLSEEGMIKLREVLTAAVANKDKNFGNARYIRNLFEKTLENQARRLASVSDLSEDVLTEIKADDIPDR